MSKELLTPEQILAMIEQLAEDAVSLEQYTKVDHSRIMRTLNHIGELQGLTTATGGFTLFELNFLYIKNILQKGSFYGSE